MEKRTDFLLLVFLAVAMLVIKYPIIWMGRHWEIYIVLRYLPDSFSGLLQSLFDRWPTGPEGWNYRPLQLSVLPYIYYKLFQWNDHYWLATNLIVSSLTILLTYVLMKAISRSKVAAFFSALFLLSFYTGAYSHTEKAQYDPDTLYIVFYLMALIVFVRGLRKDQHRHTFLACIFFILALMSKEVTATLPFMLVVAVILFHTKMIKEFIGRIRSIFCGSKMILKLSIVKLFRGKDSFLGLLWPFIVIWSIYILFRVILPLINATFDTASSRSHTLTLNPSVISHNLAVIIQSTLQLPTVVLFNNNSYSILDFVMLGLFSVALVIFIFEVKKANKIMLFGGLFYFVNIMVYVLMNSRHGMHHILLPSIGTAIIFGETIRVLNSRVPIGPLSEKIKNKNILYGAAIALSIVMLIHAYIGARRYIESYKAIGGGDQNKAYRAIERVLPKPEDRKSNTIVYIKNSSSRDGKDDHYLEVIMPGYYGKKNIILFHEYQIERNWPILSELKPEDYTIIVLKYQNLYETINVTDKKNVTKVKELMCGGTRNRSNGNCAPTVALKQDYVAETLFFSSFESWGIAPSGELLPNEFWYEQHGRGGCIKQGTIKSNIKDGKMSAVLKPSSSGASYIRHKVRNIERIKGHRIRFSSWIKSANRIPYTVNIDIQDGVGTPFVRSYRNTGKWELVTVEKEISMKAKKLLLTCSIDSHAIAPAYFDAMKIELLSSKIENLSFRKE